MEKSKEKALAIINRWIDHAHEKDLTQHKLAFWFIRDLLEGRKLHYTYSAPLVDFVTKNCKPSADRELLLKQLQEATDANNRTTALG